uniref:Sodium-coupled monocarboxylate transporter 1 n=1 Tax=Trichogramma kaykai TaxID=54128 RepID=A0ABD2X416_9HYME
MNNATSDTVFRLKNLTLGPVDYSLFGGLIGLSLLIGLYFGFFSKQNSAKEYLFGGKTMGYVPVATSMLAGHVSGITLLGVPTEVYQYGSAYFLIVISIATTCVVTTYVFLPVFYKLQLESTYEYLELRFSRRIRSLASFLYIISLVMYIPIVVYVPALAFAQVTGYNLYVIIAVLCTICIAYTSLGGVKAVIWTDTIQFAFTMFGLLIVFFTGLKTSGGFSNVWEIASKGNRTEIFDWSLSPYVRKSFWGMSISFSVILLGHFGISQNCVQRFLSISKEGNVRKALLLLGIGMVIMKVTCGLTGLTMYARYHDCDPLKTKVVKRSDQVLPYYVMDIAGHLVGLPGVFLASVVSCALSTMSASLNTLAGTIYDDFIDQWLPKSTRKEARATTIMKILSIIVGIIGMGLACFVQHLGTIFEISLSVRSIAEGPLFGLFFLGMLVPWAGKKGALIGSLVSLAFMHVLVIGNQLSTFKRGNRNTPLPTSTDNCTYALNQTITLQNTHSENVIAQDEDDATFFLFRISMMHYTLIGALITVIVGFVASTILRETDLNSLDPDYITPLMRRYYCYILFFVLRDRYLPKKEYTEVAMNDIVANKIDDNKAKPDGKIENSDTNLN